jgi:hypothetical protein
MAVDEFYFHWRRGLPRWERLGHPLDTLTVWLCQVWLCWHQPSTTAIGVYVCLSLLSCLFVTKDEFAHHQHCTAGEQWLHALLFLLHPLILLSLGVLWAADAGQLGFIAVEGWESTFLRGNLFAIFAFGIYQLLFWNWLWQRLPLYLKAPSTTKSITS